ncbi:hypothetical protein PE067_01850 [Paracoccus sp. DMF-8]|uniref:hypothetical protein n=1 Tax=Paracoccus sp. DMF-8 TaxID=3019445 RepID=UPI0023E8EF5E|nr:hypothetical protein [Paracoccus sp. DMF-8]MDF3605010.1 hypothetical protein [Paracoccus sp. DMF-8]
MLALLPFLMASLIAQGTMLTAGPDDRVAVVLCIDGSPVPMLMAADGSVAPATQDAPGSGRKAPDLCQWIAHGQPLIEMRAGWPPQPAQAEITLRRMIAPGALSRQTDIPIALARGPPVA